MPQTKQTNISEISCPYKQSCNYPQLLNLYLLKMYVVLRTIHDNFTLVSYSETYVFEFLEFV